MKVAPTLDIARVDGFNIRVCTAVKSAFLLASVVDLKIHLQRAGKKRWDKATAEQKSAAVQHASRTYWDNLSPEERSAEMKRRAQVRAKNKAKKKSL